MEFAAMRYDLVTFDFDGTLADSAPWFVGALKDLAVSHRFRQVDDAEIGVLRRLPTREIIKALGIRLWQMPGIARALRARSLAAANDIKLFDDVPDMLAGLAERGVIVAVVSSNSEAAVRAILGVAARHVHFFRCGTSLFGKAPRIAQLRRDLAVEPERALHVGDETRDVEAARKARVNAGAASYGYADVAALTAMAPDVIFGQAKAILQHCA
jgi:phosphoglycolate phosphatase